MTDHEDRPDDREIDALVRQEDREAVALGDDCVADMMEQTLVSQASYKLKKMQDELDRVTAERDSLAHNFEVAVIHAVGQKKKLTQTQALLSLAREAFEQQCRDYCEWYDHGKAGYDAPGIAYHLTTLARRAVAGLDGTEGPGA